MSLVPLADIFNHKAAVVALSGEYQIQPACFGDDGGDEDSASGAAGSDSETSAQPGTCLYLFWTLPITCLLPDCTNTMKLHGCVSLSCSQGAPTVRQSYTAASLMPDWHSVGKHAWSGGFIVPVQAAMRKGSGQRAAQPMAGSAAQSAHSITALLMQRMPGPSAACYRRAGPSAGAACWAAASQRSTGWRSASARWRGRAGRRSCR